MDFLVYRDNRVTLLQALIHSWLFWIVVIIVVILIIVLILRSNTSLQEKLHLEKFFNNDTNNNEKTTAAVMTDEETNLLQNMAFKINVENMNHESATPNLNKYIDSNLDEDLQKEALPLGISETDKNVKPFYVISSKKTNVFKVFDAANLDAVNFKLELKDLTKVQLIPNAPSEMKIYNQNGECIVKFILDVKKIEISSISPFFDNITIELEDTTRLLAFTQSGTKLFVDSKQIAALNLYDKITYFNIKTPIIKELQYM